MSGESLTLTMQPDWGLPLDIEPRVHRVDFGDDYVQRAPWGINITPTQLQMEFTNKTSADAAILMDLFQRASGGILYYTLPGEAVPRSYDIIKYGKTWVNYNAETVRVTLKETADSDAFDVAPLDDEFTSVTGRWSNYRMTGGETAVVTGGSMVVSSASFGGSPDPRGTRLAVPLQGSWTLKVRMRHVCDHPTGYYDFYGVYYSWPDHGHVGFLNSFTGKTAMVALGRPGFYTSYANATECRIWSERWQTVDSRASYTNGTYVNDNPGGNLNRSWDSGWIEIRLDLLSDSCRLYVDAAQTVYHTYTYADLGGRPDYLLLGNISRNDTGYHVTPYGRTEFDYVRFTAVT